jgi:hypothetical protein
MLCYTLRKRGLTKKTMALLPGWDAANSVSGYHKFFEVAGIVCLGVLVIFEALAYVYGHRKDELTDAAQAAKEAQARALVTQHDKQISAFGSQLSDAEKTAQEFQEKSARAEEKVNELEQKQREVQKRVEARTISPQQRAKLIPAFKPLAGSTLRFFRYSGNGEALQYANTIGEALTAAGVHLAISQVGIDSSPTYGLIIDPGSRFANVLQSAFQAAGIDFELGGTTFGVDLQVGLKPF